MSKVYGIFCDATLQSLLVGTGGTVGRVPRPREGWHLPGGTISGALFEGPSTPVPLVHLHGHLAREVGEEFGAQRARLLDRYMASPLTRFGLPLDGHSVYFVVCAVDVPLRQFVGQVRDGATDPADSSFGFVQAVGLLDALDEFRAHDPTNWFAEGVKHVNKHRALLLQ
jgi:8-oxo-dGTP pyrophosphatase MutT (NUDIX family)